MENILEIAVKELGDKTAAKSEEINAGERFNTTDLVCYINHGKQPANC
jgi:hypothetical protein